MAETTFYWLIGVIIVILLLRNTNPFRKFIGIVAGILSVILGKRAQITFSLFKYFSRRDIGVNNFAELQEVTDKPIQRVHFDDIADTLKTGDILLISGENEDPGNVIAKWASGCLFSHIALVVRYGGQLKIFESSVHYHTTLSPMKNRLEYYPSDIFAIRRLNKPLTEEMEERVLEMVFELHGREHDEHDLRGELEMFKAAVDLRIPFTSIDLIGNKENTEHLFCSELVALVYRTLGLLPAGEHDPPSNEYLPGDFTNLGGWNGIETDNVNNLLLGYQLLEEQFLYPVEPEDLTDNIENVNVTTD